MVTNEEKAKEIGRISQLLPNFPYHKASVECGALQMAEWKDSQFKEEFKVPEYCKTTEEIFNFIGNDVYAKGYNKSRDYVVRFLTRKKDNLLKCFEETNDETFKIKASALDDIIVELYDN